MSDLTAIAPASDPAVPALLPPRLPARAAEFVEVDGFRTRLFRAGEGPPLLLLPSAFLRAPSYRSTIQALAVDFGVIAAELPGSGRSARVGRGRGFAEEADWVAALLDALGLPRALVVGHSDTGGEAALLGLRHPDRVLGLVLADSVGARPGANWASLGVGRFLDGTFEESRLNLPLGLHAIAGLFHHPRNWLYHAFCLADEDGPLEVAPRITAPTLLAWGRRDHTFPPDCAERFRAAIPDSRIYWSERGSHDWLITRPREFANAVAAFARELGLLPAVPTTFNGRGDRSW